MQREGCQGLSDVKGPRGEELMIQGNLLLSPQNVYPYYDHAVRQESLDSLFLCVIFALGMFFELLGLKGLNKNGARIFARRP